MPKQAVDRNTFASEAFLWQGGLSLVCLWSHYFIDTNFVLKYLNYLSRAYVFFTFYDFHKQVAARVRSSTLGTFDFVRQVLAREFQRGPALPIFLLALKYLLWIVADVQTVMDLESWIVEWYAPQHATSYIFRGISIFITLQCLNTFVYAVTPGNDGRGDDGRGDDGPYWYWYWLWYWLGMPTNPWAEQCRLAKVTTY